MMSISLVNNGDARHLETELSCTFVRVSLLLALLLCQSLFLLHRAAIQLTRNEGKVISDKHLLHAII